MTVAEDIIAARVYGVVRCGFSQKTGPPTVRDLAREFGLSEEPSLYKEIDEAAARRLVCRVLHRDMAYNAEVMPEPRAAALADAFLAQFGPGTRYFSNGLWHLPRVIRADGVVSGPSWDPVTPATFDAGVLAIGHKISGCLWVEDED
jgi:hypothetical protein